MTSGSAAVDVDGTGRWIGLRPPTLRQWCDWLDAWHATRPNEAALSTAWSAEQASLDPRVGQLSRDVLRALSPVSEHSRIDAVPRLAMSSRSTVLQLLDFWRDTPASPWDPINLDRIPLDKRHRPIRSEFAQPGRAALSMMYRALAPAGLSPADIDGLELWQVASRLGVDDPDRGLDEDTETELNERGDAVKRTKIGDTSHVTGMSWRRPKDAPLLFTRRPVSTVG